MGICSWIEPAWPTPPSVRALTTTREGGCSQPPFSGLNLGSHVGDDLDAVLHNRALLRRSLNLPSEPIWLTQVHGVEVIEAGIALRSWEADAGFSRTPGQVCAVLTADCLPLLLCNRTGNQVAAVHAGWRGLAAGIIERTLDYFTAAGEDILVWLGPAIGSQCFEVGDEVRETFLQHAPEAEAAFEANGPGHWLLDIYLLARQRLNACGVTSLWGGDYCTVTDNERFYSYRRDGRTGRMASLIWIDKP